MKKATTITSTKVLYADDDSDDKAWVSEACKAVNCSLKLYFVENGREAINYLTKLLPSELPSLIVLDLNMPELDGRQTLKLLKKDPTYKHIPVAIVTTSSNKIDKEVCQQLGASLYLTKPDTHHEWENVIRQLEPLVN
ncbi:MAG: response regulator [Chitinophagaceae bacterium]